MNYSPFLFLQRDFWLFVIVAQFEERGVATVSFEGSASLSTKSAPSARISSSGTASDSAAAVPIDSVVSQFKGRGVAAVSFLFEETRDTGGRNWFKPFCNFVQAKY